MAKQRRSPGMGGCSRRPSPPEPGSPWRSAAPGRTDGRTGGWTLSCFLRTEARGPPCVGGGAEPGFSPRADLPGIVACPNPAPGNAGVRPEETSGLLPSPVPMCPRETLGASMSQPSAPPPYDDKNPLYPPPLGAYPPPPHYGGGYPQPGGYPAAGGYPQPGMAMPTMPTMPMRFGDGYGGAGTGDGTPFQSADWDDRKVRHTFIRKVYAIISVQLLVTVGIILIFTFVEPVSTFIRRNIAVYYASYAVFLVTYLVLVCCQGPRRRFPWNIILLSIFTLAMGFMTGAIASMHSTWAVFIAMLITAIVAIIVTIFCFQTKVDFTSCPGLFCVLGIVVMVTGIVTAIVLSFRYLSWLHMLYAAIGAIAFTLFLAYDTQLVLGNRKNTLSPEEYIYGALTIYTDIIYIFTFILQIVGRD
ncbi:protein lifeguard 3 isoform X1 [Apteryx mantelli]|uniref:Protein lifeguard 3 isoform X1 n=2 Tax=Apteryx mantelli TaxID=2696672 RepID=A0ABM4ERK4_9AVES